MNKNFIQKNSIRILTCLAIILVPVLTSKALNNEQPINAIDTIAGYSGLVEITNTPYQELEVLIQKPDKTTLAIPGKTDANGLLRMDIFGYHTKKAGIYEVLAKETAKDQLIGETTFKVYANEISVERSEISANKLIAKAGNNELIKVKIRLLDQYGNPISHHNVNLISSRGIDHISSPAGNTSNQLGEVAFDIYSTQPGISIFSVYDETAGKILANRLKVAFHNTLDIKAIGGETNILMNSVFAQASSGPVSGFKIEGIPASVKTNENINFKIIAIDKDENTTQNYLKTIRFSTTDFNATIPADYTFTSDDMGEHAFTLSLIFVTPGKHTFTVTDTENDLIFGETEIEVTGNQNLNTETSSTSSETLNIKKPVEGLYNYKTMAVEGQGPENTKIKLYDNEIETKESITNAEGNYKIETDTLSDGIHKIKIKAFDNQNNIIAESKEVTFTIDTTAPEIDSIETIPSNTVSTGENFTLKMYSEGSLAQASIIFNDELFQLNQDLQSSGLYTVSLIAPMEPGEYPVDMILVDQMGNDVSFYAKTIITVQNHNAASTDPTYPSEVTNITATPEINKIILNWSPASDSKEIKNYRVYFGTDPNNLTQTVNTFDSKTTWYIPTLTGGTEHFFSVTAINNDNNESLERSEILRAIPLTNNTVNSSASSGGPEENTASKEININEIINFEENTDHSSAAENPNSGPETMAIILASIIFANIYFRIKKTFEQKPRFTVTKEKPEKEVLNEYFHLL